jgi:hypothetical protein
VSGAYEAVDGETMRLCSKASTAIKKRFMKMLQRTAG